MGWGGLGWRRKRLFSKLPDCWLKLGRRSPGPAGPFSPLSTFAPSVVLLLCCCVVVSGISDVLCRSTCARSVHASFVLVRARTYRTIVHTYCAALSCTVLFCSVLQVTIHISLLVHIRTGAQHHTSHITTPLSLYETTRHIPPDLFRSQPKKKKPLTSPTPNHHGNISSIPAQHGDGDHPQLSKPLGLISCILVFLYVHTVLWNNVSPRFQTTGILH